LRIVGCADPAGNDSAWSEDDPGGKGGQAWPHNRIGGIGGGESELMGARGLLDLLQTGHGRPGLRFIWIWLIGPVLLYKFIGAWWPVLWVTHMAGRNVWQALKLLVEKFPLLVTLFFALWVVVFIRLRAKQEHPATLVALVRFWTEFRKYRQGITDIIHLGLIWTIVVPTDIMMRGPENPNAFPGVSVTIPPRCPRCSMNLVETEFKGGYYWTCGYCNSRRIRRQTFAQAAQDISQLAENAWRLSSERAAVAAP
jgi:DNA-directed RNA polymerase subunit RPC12/RpoP